MLNLKNTLDGYLKNVEVIGNTIQDENNLADIRSVGDKVEGQELYKIDVVSCGKNLFDTNILSGYGTFIDGVWDTDTIKPETIIEFYAKAGQTLSWECVRPNTNNSATVTFLYDDNSSEYHTMRNSVGTRVSKVFSKNVIGIKYLQWGSSVAIKDIQLEEGTVATPYEPPKGDKLEILSPVQLEKVGDVADRIICKNGVWGVEKNVETVIFDGSENWLRYYNGQRHVNCYYVVIPNVKTMFIISNKFKYGESAWDNESEDCMSGHVSGAIYVAKQNIASETDFKGWLQANPTTVKYVTTQPQFIPLPHDQQVKLRTFAGQTNIAFLTEIPGQIKAQVPKSLGATVNTHTEQIADLHNSLDRVKKLEETTVSTIETGSSFTTVDATSNGYFEGVKLEGKTLVNLLKVKNNWVCSSDNSSMCYGKYNVIKQLEPGKTYTYCYFNLPSKITQAYLGNDNSSIKLVSWTTINSIHTFVCSDDASTLTDVFPHFKTNGNETLTASEIKNIKIMLLEGNLTNNSPEFFEGLMSVGQDVEEFSVESVNENLFGGELIGGYVNSTQFDVIGDKNVYKTIKTLGVPGTYTIKFSQPVYVIRQVVDNIYSNVYVNDVTEYSFKLNTHSIFAISFRSSASATEHWDNSPITLVRGDVAKIVPQQSNKKPLLYYNPTTETWEKPVLREWDTIEKHSDGKYYYHKRSGEVTLNGNEAWGISGVDFNGSKCFWYNFSLKPGSTVVSDKFASLLPMQTEAGSTAGEGISTHHSNSSFRVLIKSSKLSTQDVAGFKAWLQANPTTIVYQLAQEKIYECTNIDLITYENETNYIIESGAISPKSLLKVHNNISNVVKILQEKVSLLENTFIAGLKSVLSGDMYSLATILYPEDFKQNDNTEQDIMVIPE